MIDRSLLKMMESDYLEENLSLFDFLDEDENAEEGNCSPCFLSYGRGHTGKVRSVPRLPNSALMLTVKLRAQKPWLACGTETGNEETTINNNEDFTYNEIQLKAAIMSTHSSSKINFKIPRRGRGRAKALGTSPDVLHFPGGLQDKFYSQPRMPVRKDPSDIYGDVNDYFKDWKANGNLQRPVSEPNINTATDFDSQFPPLGSKVKTKSKRKEHINISDDQHTDSHTGKKRLPTGKDYRAYLTKMEQKRHKTRNSDPGVHDSTEFPPLGGSDLMKGDGLVINVIPQTIQRTEAKVYKSGDGFGSGAFKTPWNIDPNGMLLKYVPAEEVLRSSSEGRMFDLSALSDASSIDLSRNKSLPNISEESERRFPSEVPDSTSRTLKFYLNAAKSHNRRITERQEDLVNNYIANTVKNKNHISAFKKERNSVSVEQLKYIGDDEQEKTVASYEQDSNIDVLEQKNSLVSLQQEYTLDCMDLENKVDCAEKDRNICLLYDNCDEAIHVASQNLNSTKYQSEEEGDMIPDLLTSSHSSLNCQISDLKTLSDSNKQILENNDKLMNQIMSSSISLDCGASDLTSQSSSCVSVSAYSSTDSSDDLMQGSEQTVLNSDGFTVVLDWKIHGKNMIQLEGLPLNADLTVVEELVASYGTIQGREIKWANQQKYVRYKLDTIDACDFAVECLHDTDCLYPDSNSVLVCRRV